ncbi:unnamed protein product [Oppiella nova]|uniref:BHLH domain-containing protein n=2 Tax=Oppiella nova TaxID=334625 RepID=A0A7R9LH46_9ACAR|nr:unnamed protein product [Oppiella nova]CAG2162893.1 unnamed protein product [Oppiella nova]
MERVTKSKHFERKKMRSKMKTSSFKLKDNLTAKNAERERSRVKSLRQAFQRLQLCLPSVPPNTKLSKLDVLILATNYISYLSKMVATDEDNDVNVNTAFECDLKFLHPIKKWPMRSRLYSMTESMDTNSHSVEEPINTIQSYFDFDSINYSSLIS